MRCLFSAQRAGADTPASCRPVHTRSASRPLLWRFPQRIEHLYVLHSLDTGLPCSSGASCMLCCQAKSQHTGMLPTKVTTRRQALHWPLRCTERSCLPASCRFSFCRPVRVTGMSLEGTLTDTDVIGGVEHPSHLHPRFKHTEAREGGMVIGSQGQAWESPRP